MASIVLMRVARLKRRQPLQGFNGASMIDDGREHMNTKTNTKAGPGGGGRAQ